MVHIELSQFVFEELTESTVLSVIAHEVGNAEVNTMVALLTQESKDTLMYRFKTRMLALGRAALREG